MGSFANFSFFDRGTFRVLPLIYLYLPKSARASFFPNLSRFITFAAAPLVLTPFVRNQPGQGGARRGVHREGRDSVGPLRAAQGLSRAHSLRFNFNKSVKSDFWGWGLSAWPLISLFPSAPASHLPPRGPSSPRALSPACKQTCNHTYDILICIKQLYTTYTVLEV